MSGQEPSASSSSERGRERIAATLGSQVRACGAGRGTMDLGKELWLGGRSWWPGGLFLAKGWWALSRPEWSSGHHRASHQIMGRVGPAHVPRVRPRHGPVYRAVLVSGQKCGASCWAVVPRAACPYIGFDQSALSHVQTTNIPRLAAYTFHHQPSRTRRPMAHHSCSAVPPCMVWTNNMMSPGT